MIDEQVAVVRVVFHNMNDLIMTQKEYKYYGGWKGCIKKSILNIRDVYETIHCMMKVSELPTQDWEG